MAYGFILHSARFLIYWILLDLFISFIHSFILFI